jgi:ribosomal protein L40E
MKEEQDDLTLVYMFGYKNGKDSMKAEIERLLLIEQGAADLCDKCGWRMKFPNEECRNCENAKLRDEIERLRAVLREIEDCDLDPRLSRQSCVEQLQSMARAALEGEKDNGND